MTQILDGKELARGILQNLAWEIKKHDLNLTLAVVSVGQNKVSRKYLEQKKRAAERVDVGFRVYAFSSGISKSELEEEIVVGIGRDKKVSGLIVQLPLPFNHSVNQSLLNLIPPEKDVDCLTAVNLGKFCQGEALVLPPVVGAIKKLFEEYKIETAGKKAVVIGAGRLVGLPVSIWLMQQGATVTICHRLTKDLARFTRSADIVISGAGQPNLVKSSMIKNGAVVVDCGTSTERGKVMGDVEFSSVVKKAGFLAPVPGGVGPLTVACLLENLLKLRKRSLNNSTIVELLP